jgi:hypothetical protein
MTHNERIAMRAAVLIHEQLAGGSNRGASICLREYAWANVGQLRRQIALAGRRGWHGAAKRLTEDLTNALESCRRELEGALRTIKSASPDRPISSAADIYRDILALETEFEDVKIELKEHLLSVTTDRITLDDVHLGDFAIRLDWQRLGSSSQPYRVEALDPNPAAKSDDITHPHVQDQQLCEGEGRAAIQAALAECRLFDFFVLVSQILHTYGRGSAYVELENWRGLSCSDCGATVSPDDSYCCQRCGNELCEECRRTCTACDESHCSDCLYCCPECEMDFCHGCMEVCPGCDRRVCAGCMEEGLCASCRDDQSEEEENHDNDAQSTDRAEE